MKKLITIAGVMLVVALSSVGTAFANTGHVFTSQTCAGWSASVTLDTNVTLDHFVEVITTIPGTVGIVDGHYNTTGNNTSVQIWSNSGAAPQSGTVTLTILNPDRSLDTTTQASLPPVSECVTTTSEATTTTSTPEATTSIPETTTTHVDTTTTPPVPTTSIPTTTSTSVPPTIPPPTTTPPATTTTQCLPGVPPCAPTGSDSAPLAMGGVVLLAAGTALILSARKVQ